MQRDAKWWKLASAIVVGASAAAMPIAASAAGMEPFAAAAQISEMLAPSGDPSCQSSAEGVALQGTIQGTGLGTAIGAFTASSVDCLRSSTPAAFFPPLTFSSTSLTLTAANGDQIVAAYSGTAELSAVGLLVLKGTYTLTRGTGAFRKVKGSGTLTGVEDISTVPARGFVSLVGQISY
jgi:maltodextrin utilization protein YvdJ